MPHLHREGAPTVTVTIRREDRSAGIGPSPAPRRVIQRGFLATAELLTDGGDARIQIEPSGWANKYGCPATPDESLAAFGSSTASVISEPAFTAADRLRRRLVDALGSEPESEIYAREMYRVRREFRDLCGLSDMPGLEIVFAASGTDLHLLAAQLIGSAAGSTPLAVMVEAAETGSQIRAALAGRHFSTRTALGNAVAADTTMADSGAIEVAAVPLRETDGAPRAAAAVDAEIEALVAAAAAAGRRVLLTLVDVSKTGLIAPSPQCANALRQRFPGCVEVLVDACQFRLAAANLRAYLEHGFMVAVTGSKFLTGPAFSGALLFPQGVAERLRSIRLPAALSAYSARADWPADWATADTLRSAANYGLLLRWEAALAEFRTFQALPETELRSFLENLAGAVRTRLANDPAFEPLPSPPLDRQLVNGPPAWDGVSTIHPFLLRRSGKLLRREETARVYDLLRVDAGDALHLAAGDPERGLAALRCQLGQPVACGQRDGAPISALRLCASARLAVEAITRNRRTAIIERALRALDKAALLARSLSFEA
jgi:hypothetical protein